jgi:hypothetical protein
MSAACDGLAPSTQSPPSTPTTPEAQALLADINMSAACDGLAPSTQSPPSTPLHAKPQPAASTAAASPAAAAGTAEPPAASTPQPATQPQHGAAGAEAALAQAAGRTNQRVRREEEEDAIDLDARRAKAEAEAEAAAAAAVVAAARARAERLAMRGRSAELRAQQAADVAQEWPAGRADNQQRRALLEAQAAFLLCVPQMPLDAVFISLAKDKELQDAMVELSARVLQHGMPVYEVVKRVTGHQGTNALVTARGEEAAAHSAREQRQFLRAMAEYDRAIGAGQSPCPFVHHTAAATERGILPTQGGILVLVECMSRDQEQYHRAVLEPTSR